MLNLKFVFLLEYQNIKTFFAKGYVLNWFEGVFVVRIVKSTVPQTYVISNLKGEEIAGTFLENELEKNKSKRVQSWKSNKEKR